MPPISPLFCFLAVPIPSFPLTALPLTSLLPFLSPSLISSIKALLSGLCQGGMLTTPGIVTLWEFTPLKVFITSSSLFLSSLSLSFSSVHICFIPVFAACFLSFVLHHPWFFSSIQVHIDTHTPPSSSSFSLYRSVSGTPWHRLCGGVVINKPDCFQNTTTFNFSCFSYSDPRDMCYVWIL